MTTGAPLSPLVAPVATARTRIRASGCRAAGAIQSSTDGCTLDDTVNSTYTGRFHGKRMSHSPGRTGRASRRVSERLTLSSQRFARARTVTTYVRDQSEGHMFTSNWRRHDGARRQLLNRLSGFSSDGPRAEALDTWRSGSEMQGPSSQITHSEEGEQSDQAARSQVPSRQRGPRDGVERVLPESEN